MRFSPDFSRRSAHPLLIACLSVCALAIVFGSANSAVRSATPSPAATRSTTLIATRSATATIAPTIDPATLLSNAKADVVFPVLIRLLIDVKVPTDQVKSAQLTISQGSFTDTSDVTLTFGKTIFILANQASRIDTQWSLAGHERLKLFQEVAYQWKITLKSGQTASTTGKFLYQDTVRRLTAFDIDQLTVYAPPSLSLGITIPTVKAARQLIVRDTGIDQPQIFAVYPIGLQICIPDPAHAGQFTIVDQATDSRSFPCDPTETARLYAGSGIDFLQVSALSPFALSDDLIVRLATDAYDALWTSTAGATGTPSSATASRGTARPPDWFRSGLAALYASNGRLSTLDLVRLAARTDTLFTLDELTTQPTFTGNSATTDLLLWNGQSYLLTLYLISKYGADSPVRLAKQLAAQPGNFLAALNSVTGGTALADLTADWQAWLFSPAAAAALSYSPYPANVTPTNQPTVTPGPTFTPYTPHPIGTATRTSATPGS